MNGSLIWRRVRLEALSFERGEAAPTTGQSREVRGVELDLDRRRRLLAERVARDQPASRGTAASSRRRQAAVVARLGAVVDQMHEAGVVERRIGHQRAVWRGPACSNQQQAERGAVAGSPCRARRGTSRRRRTRPRPRWPARPSPPPLAAVARLPARHNHVGGARADAAVVDFERAHLAPARRQLVVARQHCSLGSRRRSSGRRRRISAASCSIVTAASTSSATHWRRADPGRRGRAPIVLSSRDQRRAHDRVAAGAGIGRTCDRVDRRGRRQALSVQLNSQIAVLFVADAALWAGGRRARRAP